MTTKKSHTKPRRAKHRAKPLKTAPLGKTVKPGEVVTVDRGAPCSHPGAGGPCMPRVRDGRCVWCERLMPARSEGPLPVGAVEEAARRVIPELTPEQAERAKAFREKTDHEYRERYLSALSNLVSGGLTVDTEHGADLPPERAMMRVAGALVKAVTIAAFGPGHFNMGPDGWDPDSGELTECEATLALTGISTLLTDGATVLSRLQVRGRVPFELRADRSRQGPRGAGSSGSGRCGMIPSYTYEAPSMDAVLVEFRAGIDDVLDALAIVGGEGPGSLELMYALANLRKAFAWLEVETRGQRKEREEEAEGSEEVRQ